MFTTRGGPTLCAAARVPASVVPVGGIPRPRPLSRDVFSTYQETHREQWVLGRCAPATSGLAVRRVPLRGQRGPDDTHPHWSRNAADTPRAPPSEDDFRR